MTSVIRSRSRLSSAPASSRLGRIDILINNAAAVRARKSVEEMTVQEWRTTIGTNLDGVFYGCHFAVPEMKKAGGGFIINISSLAGKHAFAGGSAYNASKFGLTGLSEALMEEVRHDGIRVAYVMPGSVNTGSRSTSGAGGVSWKMAPEDVAEVVVQTPAPASPVPRQPDRDAAVEAQEEVIPPRPMACWLPLDQPVR